MGAPKCRIVGKSQSVLMMINPIIFTRTRISLAVVCDATSPARYRVRHARARCDVGGWSAAPLRRCSGALRDAGCRWTSLRRSGRGWRPLHARRWCFVRAQPLRSAPPPPRTGVRRGRLTFASGGGGGGGGGASSSCARRLGDAGAVLGQRPGLAAARGGGRARGTRARATARGAGAPPQAHVHRRCTVRRVTGGRPHPPPFPRPSLGVSARGFPCAALYLAREMTEECAAMAMHAGCARWSRGWMGWSTRWVGFSSRTLCGSLTSST
jgi:hypothetical protein|eukprot:COSAG01_NODE_127_length_24940_cov_140.519923_12_plen_268_part_00